MNKRRECLREGYPCQCEQTTECEGYNEFFGHRMMWKKDVLRPRLVIKINPPRDFKNGGKSSISHRSVKIISFRDRRCATGHAVFGPANLRSIRSTTGIAPFALEARWRRSRRRAKHSCDPRTGGVNYCIRAPELIAFQFYESIHIFPRHRSRRICSVH